MTRAHLRRGLILAAAVTLLGSVAAGATGSPAPARAVTPYAHAAAVVRAQGYVVDRPSDWTPGNALNALTATARGSADGYNQRAFLFARGRFLGVDAPEPSAQLRLVWSNGETVALLYLLYRGSDALCCPTGGGAIVRFHWNGHRLQTMGRIPPTRGALHR